MRPFGGLFPISNPECGSPCHAWAAGTRRSMRVCASKDLNTENSELGTALAAIRAHSDAGGIDDRQEHFTATLMFVGAVFTKPPSAPALAIGADLRCGLLPALLAGDLRCVISRQQLDSVPTRSPVPKSQDFQAEFGCRAIVILVGEYHSWLKDSAEPHVHS